MIEEKEVVSARKLLTKSDIEELANRREIIEDADKVLFDVDSWNRAIELNVVDGEVWELVSIDPKTKLVTIKKIITLEIPETSEDPETPEDLS